MPTAVEPEADWVQMKIDLPGIPTVPVRTEGYPRKAVLSATGVTYRQLDHWARTGFLVPSIQDAHGSGSRRLYSYRDLVIIRTVKRLLDAGVSQPNVRKAIDTLHRLGEDDLATVTLISDGNTVYLCHSGDEILDLLRGGQAVFVIAIASTVAEIQSLIAHDGGLIELPTPGSSARSDTRSDTRSSARPDNPPRPRRRKAS
jgi:DNA-binding transcriptional MerR regulator